MIKVVKPIETIKGILGRMRERVQRRKNICVVSL
jgi:hypothetical protein